MSAVLPKINENYLPGIKKINELLYEAQKFLDFKLIEHPFFVSNGTIDKSLFAKVEVENNRPIHLSKRGVIQFASDIKTVLKARNMSLIKKNMGNKPPAQV